MEKLFVDDNEENLFVNDQTTGKLQQAQPVEEACFVDTVNAESVAEDNDEDHVEGNDNGKQLNGNSVGDEAVDIVQLASILKDFSADDTICSGNPAYMLAIIKELLESDFLLVLGRGLGLGQILKLFLTKIKQVTPRALVLVMGSRDDDDDEGDENAIGFGVLATKRAKMYARGGIYHITAPIAVVDILTGTLDCKTVSGLVLMQAEKVGEQSPAAFAIRLLKQHNPYLFIKALSESPERLVMPPSLPVRLRVLGVPSVSLWPRFHLAIDKTLPKLEVDEIIVEQLDSVRKQQALLSELVQAVLSDIKRRVPHLDVDYLALALGQQEQQPTANPERLNDTTTVDSVLATPDLAYRIRNALKGVWHQLSRDGKRSVHSLSVLAQLQHTLVHHDSRSFREQLEFARQDTDSPWVDLPAADMLIAEARTAAVLSRVPGKFQHLKQVLARVTDGKRVLILCGSPKTVRELMEFLQDGALEQDEDALRAYEEELRKTDEEDARKIEQALREEINRGRPGRRRIRGGKSFQLTRPQDSQDSQVSQGSVVVEEVRSLKRTAENNEGSEVAQKRQLLEPIENECSRLDIVVTTFGSSSLQATKPAHIIIFDPDLPFIREVERYVASSEEGETVPEVHFMYYQRSVEEFQYLATMRREKDAFTKLIREKGLMPLVFRDEEAEQNVSRLVAPSRVDGHAPQSERRSYATNVRHRLVVDVREFRSALPFLVWQQRMDVVPLTLLVGDYILTPEIVVERKSINDLVGSFRNGRLYDQCESMLKHYKIAVLLIEFDGPSHFSMEPFRDIRSRTRANIQREIQENLSTLLLRYPKLKLIWSSSPLHSAQIIRGLKEMEPEPEIEACAMAGRKILFESVALSMLEALPGITAGNAHLLAGIATTMADVVTLSQQQLVKTLGPENGNCLFRFLHHKR